MAPPLSPDPSYYTINGAVATVFPTGSDDYDNLQTVLNTLAGQPNAVLRLAGGEFFTRYGLRADDFSGTVEGAGRYSTSLTAGTPSAPMQLLDATDRAIQNPAGSARLISFQESLVGGQAISLTMRGLTLQGSQVKGETGVGFGGTAYRNIGADVLLNIGSQTDSMTIFDVQVQLNATTPAPVGDTNILNVVVAQNALQTGTIYVEGVDYSVDLATGEVTRIGTGAIGDGQTVFVTYNNAFNYRTVPLVNVNISDVAFLGVNHRASDGELHQNVHAGLVIQGGRPFYKAVDANNVFSGFVVTSLPEYAGLFFDRASEPTMFLTGSVTVSNCEFARCNLGIVLQGFEGAAAAGPYIFPAGIDRATASITQCSFDDCGNEHTGLPAMLINNLSACDVSFSGNKGIMRTGGFVSLRLGQVHTVRRLAGWIGRTCNWTFENNDITLHEPTNQLHGGNGRAIQVRASTPAASSPATEASFSISRNTIRQSKLRPFTKRAIQVQEAAGVVIADNVFIGGQNVEGANLAGNAIDIVGESATISGNDFSKWAKAPNARDVFLGGGATGCTVSLDANDGYEDQGAGNTVTGGIASP